MSLRVTVPLGLNACPPFLSITKSLRQPSILPPARTVIEDETRRNTFWLAYAMERMHGSGNGWALSLDDQDVTQLMPVRGDQFDQGVSQTCVILIVLCCAHCYSRCWLPLNSFWLPLMNDNGHAPRTYCSPIPRTKRTRLYCTSRVPSSCPVLKTSISVSEQSTLRAMHRLQLHPQRVKTPVWIHVLHLHLKNLTISCEHIAYVVCYPHRSVH
jgi:hypothetical protein